MSRWQLWHNGLVLFNNPKACELFTVNSTMLSLQFIETGMHLAQKNALKKAQIIMDI